MKLLKYWLNDLGCNREVLCKNGITFSIHPEIDGYERVFYLQAKDVTVVSIPRRSYKFFCDSLSANFNLELLHTTLLPYTEKVIGPAWIGSITKSSYINCHDIQTRVINSEDRVEYSRFLTECTEADIRNSGFLDTTLPVVGVFSFNRIVAAANYNISKDKLANIGVITSPLFRGKAFGKQAISGIVEKLMETDYLIQYQTLKTNISSVKAAKSVGFEEFAETCSYKLKSPN